MGHESHILGVGTFVGTTGLDGVLRSGIRPEISHWKYCYMTLSAIRCKLLIVGQPSTVTLPVEVRIPASKSIPSCASDPTRMHAMSPDAALPWSKRRRSRKHGLTHPQRSTEAIVFASSIIALSPHLSDV